MSDSYPNVTNTCVSYTTGVVTRLAMGFATLPLIFLAQPSVTKAMTGLHTALSHGVAGSTMQSRYSPAWNKFCAWLPPQFDPFEASPAIVNLYFGSLYSEAQEKHIGPGTLETARSAIGFFFRQAGVPPPTMGPMTEIIFQGAARSLTTQSLDRQPLTSADMLQLLEVHLTSDCSLRTRMHLTVLLLAYVGLLRYDDMSHILVHHEFLRFKRDQQGNFIGVLMFLFTGKTDQTWSGKWVAIGATGGKFCPVALLHRLLEIGGYVQSSLEDCGPLLRAVRWSPKQQQHYLQQHTASLDSPISALSYDAFRKHVLSLVAEAGIHKCIGLHSPRIGGATNAILAGCDRTLVRTLGRWKWANVMDDTYIRLLMADTSVMFHLTRKFWPY